MEWEKGRERLNMFVVPPTVVISTGLEIARAEDNELHKACLLSSAQLDYGLQYMVVQRAMERAKRGRYCVDDCCIRENR